MTLAPGDVVAERYVVESRLGQGAFATVWAVRHATLGSPHALKVLSAHLEGDPRRRFLAEGRIQASLSHRNLVRVTDLVEVGPLLALVLDRVDGETLADRLERGRLPLRQAFELGRQILEGVAAAHRASLVHRDLKPSNILLDREEVARVSDFGLARARDETLRGPATEVGLGMGTPGYMAPEAYVDASSVDARADVFSLGCVLFELIAGTRAFPWPTPWLELYQRAVAGRHRLDEAPCDPRLLEVVRDALEPSAARRPADAAELLALWLAAEPGRSQAPAAPPPALPGPPTHEVRALLLTDVVDSTKLAESLGDVAMASLWARHDRLARDLLLPHHGREIDKTDGFLLLFASAADAVAYAVGYHQALLSLELSARAGLHVGPVILTENRPEDVALGAKPLEVDGIAKPTAARVMSLARGGQTLMTVEAKEALGPTTLRVISHGHWRMKGVAEPPELFEVGDEAAPFAPPADGAKVYRVVRSGELWVPVKEVRRSLPAERDAFVGRADDLRALADAIDGGARLVSVFGPAGVGKTRLVTRYAWTWLGDWPGGVWLCDLTAARDVDAVVTAVARTLGVPLGTEDPVAELGRAIARLGKGLVLLDHLDPFPEVAQQTLGRWLDAAPDALFVTTARQTPGLRGETGLALAPLVRDDAASLFLRRAVAAMKDFAPTPAEVAAIGSLVEHLDRVPLAIELAAAQVRTLPPSALLARLEASATRLLTLVLTDVPGSTSARQRLGDRAYGDALQAHDAILRRALVEVGDGEELESSGDVMVLAFGTPSAAVWFALRARAGLRAWNADRAVPLGDRYAVHLGEVVVRKGARAGLVSLTKDTCARVQSLADADRILLTRSVFDNARQHLPTPGLTWWNHGNYTFAGIDAPTEVCEVAEVADGPRAAPKDQALARRVAETDQEGVSGWRPSPGATVPGTPYVLERGLGEGAVGEVWVARHGVLQERRVFKFCFGAERLRLLRREVAIFRVLRDRVGAHPHIASVQDVRLDEPPCWLMAEYTEGVDLLAWWDSRAADRPPLAERLELVAQVAEGLQAAHDAGVVHCDVKPANVLVEVVSGRLHARLTDFGIGQVTSSELLGGRSEPDLSDTTLADAGATTLGTRMFMAPELVSGGVASPRSDLYALGVVLWQLAAGDLRRAPPMDWDRSIPDELLREDLRRCFAGDPAERWNGAMELGRSLRELERRRADRSAQESPASRSPAASNRRHYLLELQVLRVGETYRVALSHTDADGQARAPLRADAPLNPPGLRALHRDPTAYGRQLAAQLFADERLRRRFSELERAAEAAGSVLRLSVAIDPSAQNLHSLRWELLCHPETGGELASSERILLCRYMAGQDARRVQLRGRSDLVAVVAVSAPAGPRFATSGLPPVDLDGEVDRIRAALDGTEIRVVGGPGQPLTLARLAEALRGGVDVLYLVSHGGFRRSTDTPVLLLQDTAGDSTEIDGEALGSRVAELPEGPRLVVLSCPARAPGEAASDERPSAQASLAGRLTDAGVPAVLALQGPMTRATLEAMMPAFFAELLRDGQVDRALAVARSTVRGRDDAWMPALFCRVRDGRLWYTAGFRTGGDGAEIWRRLLPAVRAGKLLPILGPGLLRNLLGPPSDIALELARANHFPLAAHDWDDLARVNQYLSVRESRFNVVRSVQEQMVASVVRRHRHWLPEDEIAAGKRPKLGRLLGLVADHLRETDAMDPHAMLAGLDASVYLTTTFDPLLERALKAAGKEPQQLVTRWRHKKSPAPAEPPARPPSPRDPVVFHAFGAFRADDDGSLVLTEDDFFDYLIGTTAAQLLPHTLQSALVDNSLLFVGFRLTDWTFRVLFRLMMNLPGRERLKDYCHVAVQLDPELETMEDVAGAKAYLAQYFGQESNIDIFWGSGPEFLGSLRAELARAGVQAQPPPADEEDGWDF